MAKEKKIGHGISIKLGSTTITQVRNLQPAAISREDVDATTLEDTVQYNLPSDPEDPGEVSFEELWQSGDTNSELINTDFEARTIATWSIVFSTWTVSRTATFSAWVKSISPAAAAGTTALSRTITLRLTTTITWTNT